MTQSAPPTLPAPPSSAEPARGWRSRLRWIWFGLLVVGSTITGAVLSNKVQPGKSAPLASEPNLAALPDSTDTENPRSVLESVDQSIREGRYEAALSLCRTESARATGTALDALDYRGAVCLEALGDPNAALEAYRTLSSRNPETRVAVAARLGLARLSLLQHRPEAARAILTTFLLRSAQPTFADPTLRTDASFLLGFAVAAESGANELPGALRPFGVARPQLTMPFDLLLQRGTAAVEPDKNRVTPPPDTLQMRRLGAQPEEILVTAAVNQGSYMGFLNRIAQESGVRMQWTPESQRHTGGRTVTVAVDDMPLPELVRLLALEADLSWNLAGQSISFSTIEEQPERTRATTRLETARKILQDAIVAAPSHELAPAAYLALGNLEVGAGRLKEGLSWYERQCELSQQRSRIPAELLYNLGVVRTQLGEKRAARDALYWVVDRAPGSDLALLAYLQIGRLLIDEFDPGAAIRPLRRATSASSVSATRPTAVLLLAAAFLLTDAPRAAHSALADLGSRLQDEPYRRPAALLDALARYRAQPDRDKANREAGDLISALLNYREEPVLGPPGVLLAGRAYRDLGLPNEMAALYEKSEIDRTSGLGLEITADLAEHHFTTGQFKMARSEFEAVVKGGSPRTRAAELRLAEIDLADRKPDDCLKRCRRLYQDMPKEGRILLLLMSRAYTLKGDTARASRCAAGDLPD